MSTRSPERPLVPEPQEPSGKGALAEQDARLPESRTAAELENGAGVRQVRTGLGLTRRDFARLTGFSERAIADWEAGKPLSGPGRQRMREVQALQRELCAIAEPGEIGPWLLRPSEAFGGLKPLEVVERGEIHRLWQMLFWLQSGVPG